MLRSYQGRLIAALRLFRAQVCQVLHQGILIAQLYSPLGFTVDSRTVSGGSFLLGLLPRKTSRICLFSILIVTQSSYLFLRMSGGIRLVFPFERTESACRLGFTSCVRLWEFLNLIEGLCRLVVRSGIVLGRTASAPFVYVYRRAKFYAMYSPLGI